MDNWQHIVISPSATIQQAIECLDRGGVRFVMIADEQMKLLGVITDGDVRRGLIHHVALSDPVSKIMNVNPAVAKPDTTVEQMIKLLKGKVATQMPVVNDAQQLVGLHILDELIGSAKKDNLVVLMVGGLGSRLGEMTKNTPKPLLEICGKPILEIILERFIAAGFSRFVMATHYKANSIQDYFGDGARYAVDIRYIQEEKQQGTAGSLGHLPEIPHKPMLVMNGDVLTNVDFASLLSFHTTHQSQATMCVKRYEHQIPYGVVRTQQGRIEKIDEKPITSYFVNAGIYVINPELLPLVPQNQPYDMPQLFTDAKNQGYETMAFPVREYWKDIGYVEDYHRAGEEYSEVFA